MVITRLCRRRKMRREASPAAAELKFRASGCEKKSFCALASAARIFRHSISNARPNTVEIRQCLLPPRSRDSKSLSSAVSWISCCRAAGQPQFFFSLCSLSSRRALRSAGKGKKKTKPGTALPAPSCSTTIAHLVAPATWSPSRPRVGAIIPSQRTPLVSWHTHRRRGARLGRITTIPRMMPVIAYTIRNFYTRIR